MGRVEKSSKTWKDSYIPKDFWRETFSIYHRVLTRRASIWERQLEPGNLVKQINFSLFESRNKTASCDNDFPFDQHARTDKIDFDDRNLNDD